jgi:hypothetical protein
MSTFQSRALLLLLSLSGLLVACENPNPDAFRRNGGAAPDPTAVLEGSVLYVGPRPSCDYYETGEPARIRGRIALLLFDYDNPPPPAGSATTAKSLLIIPGRDVFSLEDCRPESPTMADLAPIMRSVAFTWPEIELGTRSADPATGELVRSGASYQIRGFYDDDGDFNPFFSVRNLATAGDIGGGAVVSATAAVPTFARIEVPNIDDAPNGVRVQGVAVTLGALIQNERPIFEVDETTQALSSEATIPLIADAIALEQALYDLADMRVSLVASGGQTDGAQVWSNALAAAGVQVDFSPRVHGMPIFGVDANGDGLGDPHPILGSNGVAWYHPVIIMQRARSPIEVAVGIPPILLIGSIRPTVVAGVTQGFVQRETLTTAEVIVPPVAVMVTNPALPVTCRVPLIAPGNIAELYETPPGTAPSPRDCQELPSGNYDVNVLSGMAGGRAIDIVADCVAACVAAGTDEATCTPGCQTQAMLQSDTGYRFEGGSYSSQAWSVPNELGCPDTAYRPTAIDQLDAPHADGTFPLCGADDTVMLTHQGRQGSFAIVDPNGANAPADPTTTDVGHGDPRCQMALRTTGPMALTVDTIHYTAVSDACCPTALLRLCGLPLCPLRDAMTREGYPEGVRASGTSRQTREMRVEGEDYTVAPDGTITPLCVPFMMPTSCCTGGAI